MDTPDKYREKRKYIIQVAPLIRLPITRTQVFSYLYEKPIAIGSLVRVPFGRRNISGIVVSSRKDFPRVSGMRLKKINFVEKEGLLEKWQIDFAGELSDYYLSSLGMFLNLMAPKIYSKLGKVAEKKLSLDTKKTKTIENSKNKKSLIVGPANERLKFNLKLAAECIKKEKQCLILVPEIYHSYEMRDRFQEAFPNEEIALFHGKVAKGKFFKLWNKIREGEIKIIIATKLGVFLPYAALGTVIIEEEQDISHKQWNMSPRYNAVRAALFLGQIHSASIVLGSSSPSVEIFWEAKEKKWKVLNLDAKKNTDKETKIIDLFKERKNPDFPISKELYENISQALLEKKKVLLLAKRRGYSTLSVCRNCKSILKCPECNRALPYFEESSSYRCLHCSFSVDLFTACPKCGSHQFSHLGIGTQQVARRIKRFFPSAKIVRFDADSVRTPRKYEKLSGRIRSGQVDIAIGTQIALKPGGFFSFDLVSIVSAHDFLSIPDFNSRELALSSFRQAKNIVKKNGKFVVQTFSPREPLFPFLDSEKYADFFEKELAFKKKLFYPPFSRMIKLSYRDKFKKKTGKETKKIFDLLKATGNNEIEITEPYEPMASKKRGFFYKNILIKVESGKNLCKLPMRAIIGGLKKGWTVDVDPISTV